MTIADRVLLLREEIGWTQADLADASGVSVTAVSLIERGGDYYGSTLRKLAAALNTTFTIGEGK